MANALIAMKLYPGCLNKKKRQGFILASLLILALFLPVQKKGQCQGYELSKEQIIQIAIEAFREKGGNLKERIIIYDIANGQWDMRFENLDKELAAKFDVLIGKNYQAIRFKLKPRPGLKGKDVWVFVDRITGAVLALYVE